MWQCQIACRTGCIPALIGQGAQVYSTTCARCHNARPGSERTDREWVAIVAHMRARANLSKTQAAGVLAFLQATNVPEAGIPMAWMPEVRKVVPDTTRAPTSSNEDGPGASRNER